MTLTASDILFLVLAACAVVLTYFLARLLFYWVGIMRQARDAVQQITAITEKVQTIAASVEEAVKRSSGHLSLIVTAVQQLVSFYQKRRSSERADDDAPEEKKKKK